MPKLESRGDGDVVLMLHGLGAHSGVFEPLQRELGPTFRTITVDLPHHARARPWSPLEPRAVAEKLAAVVQAEQFYVVGHSFGGIAALELAVLLPSRVSGVCAIAAPASGIGALRGALDSKFAELTMRIASRVAPSTGAVRAYMKFIWGDGTKPTPGQIQGYLLAMEAEGHHQGTLQALRSLAQYTPPLQALRSVRVALVFGERDPLVPARHGAVLAKEIGASVDILRGAGHCIPEERPVELAAIIRRELRRTS